VAKTGRSEKAIQNDTLVAVTALPETIAWRNNTGQAWAGKRLHFYPGTTTPVPSGIVVLSGAQPITYGLPGSGDILGASVGRPLSIEVKDATGQQSEQQVAFQRAWEAAGGVYMLVRDPEDAARRVAALNISSVLG